MSLVISFNADEELHGLPYQEGIVILPDGGHHGQQLFVLRAPDKLARVQTDPILWFLAVVPVEYNLQLLIDVRPVVIKNKDDTQLSMLIHFNKIEDVVAVEHHSGLHTAFIYQCHGVIAVIDDCMLEVLSDPLEDFGLIVHNRRRRDR